ncbi:hypothetical protein H2202_008775 [Exophiala xenobiotica]|nr:hypothetical protein H2202_008775 [Exophiala xenobiotica]KAK5212281.1 hypothetical protein LTR41_002523 [Exophiala xenobiotica]KAK5219637.1 hypothetical protein LTR72_008021 [Exophiala xenobiotica]KAK5288141.1 hypothetical protein LTR14_008478 [Exophiala xenobiotica]KAK5321954.1 hypothetical protein LTR93_006192 [Exophiala xenobiotica]
MAIPNGIQNGTSNESKGPIKIGVISACQGDRADSLLQTLSGPIEVDAIVGDYLAELNLAWHAMQYEKDQSAGYDKGFLRSMELASTKIAERFRAGKPIKFAVNAGALNPVALAKELRKFFDTCLGPEGENIKIVYVSGDNVLHQLKKDQVRKSLRHLTGKTTYADWSSDKTEVVANVYIGQWGVVKALEEGADVVITGRSTDASTLQALSSWWHGWKPTDYDFIAQSLVTGHVVECGTYVTGGNFGGFKVMGKDYINLSFPIAEISADGTTVVTKQPGQNGIVTVDTVRSQLLYEIQGRYYYNPDVIADLYTTRITAIGKDRVLIEGTKGLPPPENLKVSVQAYGGFQAEVNALAIGLDIEEKAESWGNMTRAILRSDEKLNTGEYSDFTIQCIGRAEPNPRNQNAATAHVRVLAQAPNKETLSVDNFMNTVIENLISGFPGFTPDMEYLRTGLPKPYMTYFPGLIPRSVLEEVRVHFLDGSESIAVPHPAGTLSYETAPKQENYEPNEPVDLASFGETVSIPLGYKVHARSGDKGANVNVGFFPQKDSEEEWEWLRSFMTTNKLMELLGDDAEDVLRTERTEFPNLHGVHFVLVGILGDGVNCTKRPDALGKGIGEYVRAKYVDYPKKMYDGYEKRI